MNMGKMINEQIALIVTVTLLGAAAVILLVLLPMMYRAQGFDSRESILVKDAGLIDDFIKTRDHNRSEASLVALNDAAIVMQEITDLGNAHAITFLSVVNQDKSKLSYKKINTLPIDLEIRTTYKQWGWFLGALNDLTRGIVLIDSFQIMRDTQEPDKLKAKIHMYICLKSAFPSKKEGKASSVSHKQVLSLIKAYAMTQAPVKTAMAWGERNPFDDTSMPRRIVKKEEGKKDNTSVVTYDLSGIFWNEQKPSAIINDLVVTIGSVVGSSTVKAIRPGEVVLFDGTKDIVLMLRQN